MRTRQQQERDEEAGRRIGRCGSAKKQALARGVTDRWVRSERAGDHTGRIQSTAEWIERTTQNEGTDAMPALEFLSQVYEATLLRNTPRPFVALRAELLVEAALEGAENIEQFRFAAQRRPTVQDLRELIAAVVPSIESQRRVVIYAMLTIDRMLAGEHEWAA